MVYEASLARPLRTSLFHFLTTHLSFDLISHNDSWVLFMGTKHVSTSTMNLNILSKNAHFPSIHVDNFLTLSRLLFKSQYPMENCLTNLCKIPFFPLYLLICFTFFLHSTFLCQKIWHIICFYFLLFQIELTFMRSEIVSVSIIVLSSGSRTEPGILNILR